MFKVAVGLTDCEYDAWVDETSCVSSVVLFSKKVDTVISSRAAWGLLCVLACVCASFEEWNILMLVQEVFVACLAVMALTLGRALPSRHATLGGGALSRSLHFVLVGVCSKYRHTCWAPGTASSAVMMAILLLLGKWIACIAVGSRTLFMEENRRRSEDANSMPT